MVDQPPLEPDKKREQAYRGRFAPSPTGPLHAGSLVAALASWLDARAHDGQWLLRIEDVDAPRCRAQWADQIMRQLEALGLQWDGEVRWQSRCTERYRLALEQLRARNLAFGCRCTRRELESASLSSDGARRYPGTCRDLHLDEREARAWRFRVGVGDAAFLDGVQGPLTLDVAADAGDFVLWRADGYCAYQLAVVVDDAEQGVSDVVRGADLLWSTPRQLLLQQALGLASPRYAHIPVLCDGQGQKLSKQRLAPALCCEDPAAALRAALLFLNHVPPPELADAPAAELLVWARQHWSLQQVRQSVC